MIGTSNLIPYILIAVMGVISFFQYKMNNVLNEEKKLLEMKANDLEKNQKLQMELLGEQLDLVHRRIDEKTELGREEGKTYESSI